MSDRRTGRDARSQRDPSRDAFADTDDALGLAPRAVRRSRGTGPAGGNSTDGEPPRLRTGLWGGLKLLLLMNIVPLIGLGWLAWAWWNGRVSLAHFTRIHVAVIIAIVIACAVVALSSWLVMPVARWLRAYPAWHFRHHSRVAWALPALGGLLAWLALWLLCAAALLIAAGLVGSGLYALAHR